MFKMRRLILLGLVGLILSAPPSNVWPPGSRHPNTNENGFNVTTNSSTWPPGSRRPMENENGFNVTTNSSTAPEQTRENDTRVQWNGTRHPIENTFGFPPESADEEVTKWPKGGTAPLPVTTKKPTLHGVWHPLENDYGFPPEPTDGNVVQQGQQK